jgi:hypothetical protein
MGRPAGTINRLRLGLITVVMAFTISMGGIEAASAQEGAPDRYTLVLRGVAMDRALEELARLAQIDLVYSSGLAANRYVYCDGRGLSAESLLRCILAGSDLDYVRSSSGTYVLIEALQAPPQRGHLGGRVIDAATGEPLPYANVLLADASAGTTTDAAGLFSFSSLVSGPHRVVATYIGYETAIDSIVVTPGDRNRLEIPLTPEPVHMGPIVINGLTQKLSSQELGSGSVSSAEFMAQSTLGTADVTRAAGGLAGVAVRHPLADLHIQGAAGGDHLTELDGVPVRDPVTLGRHLGAFSPLAIDRITVHKAGFGAALGSHQSGVVTLDHDVSDQADRSAAFSIDPLSLNGRIQARFPLSKGRVAGGMLAARTGLWTVFRDPGLENLLDRWNAVDPILAGIWIDEDVNTTSLISRRHVPDLAFSDLHAAGRINLGPFHSVYASAYRARNQIASELSAVNSDSPFDPDRLVLTKDDYDWTNWTAQARHAWLAGARSVVTTQVRASRHTSRYLYLSAHAALPSGASAQEVEQAVADLRTVLDSGVGSDEENEIREIAVEAAVSRSLSPSQHLDIGLEAERINSRFMLRNQFVRPFAHESNVWEVAGYVENRMSLGLRTGIDPGLRLTYLPARQTVYAEPRLSVRYDGDAGRLGSYALRVAGGLYRQFIPSFSLTSSGSTSVVPFVRFWLPVDRSVAPPRSYHLALETLVTPGRMWQFAFEAYRKWQPRMLVVDYQTLMTDFASVRPRPDPIELPQSTFVQAVRGRAWGAVGRVSLDAGLLSTTLQYSYSHAEQLDSDRFEGEWQPVEWNLPHRLQLRFQIAISSALAFHANAESTWGRPWAFRRAYYDYLAFRPDSPSFAPFNLEDPSTPLLPASYRVDPGFTYDRSWGRARLEIQAVLVNMLDRNDVFDWSLEDGGDGYDRVARVLPGRRPVFSLNVAY